MHPLDMMNKAFVAAAVAEQDGFLETAQAFREIAFEAFRVMSLDLPCLGSSDEFANATANVKLYRLVQC